MIEVKILFDLNIITFNYLWSYLIMKIQPLLFSSDNICDIEELYYRRKGSTLSLETYFNAFSIGKWCHYTSIASLTLCIRTQHALSIRCFNSVGSTLDGCNCFADVQTPVDMAPYVSVTRQEIPADVRHTDDMYYISFPDIFSDSSPDGKLPSGILYAELTFPFELEDTDVKELIDGWYETDSMPVRSPYIALGICTYKREEFLLRNVHSLMDNIINNPDSPMYNRLAVYISDNAGTIIPGMPSSEYTDPSLGRYVKDHIHVFSNRNIGGAGGFTRTMSEAVLNNIGHQFSHLLLMDDDIVLDTAVLERTYLFLSFLKEEFLSCMLGASMLDLNRRYLQLEKGARTDSYAYTFYHKFFDLRNADLVSANECPENASYTGWWYCCIPTQHIRTDNLPLPMFLHFDDVEYGIRAGCPPILLNGICVWHPPAVSKGAAGIEYYDIRNMLIMQASDKKLNTDKLHTLLHISFLTVGELVRYRYNVADARLMGCEDFHRGPEYFIQTDPAKKHADLGVLNYSFISPEEAGIRQADIERLMKQENNIVKKSGSSTAGTLTKYLLCLLCHLLPPVGGTKICNADLPWLPYPAHRVYVYSPSTGKGYIVVRSCRRFFKGMGRYFKTVFHIIKDFTKDTAAWNSRMPYLTSKEFWDKYLK